jgi:hypothetical protein
MTDMSALKPVEDMAKYYQEFHHKCITWYVSILGFFIAGVVAAPTSTSNGKVWIIPLLVFALAIAGIFSYYIFHYSARIQKLNQYLSKDEAELPKTWRTDHKVVAIGLHGVGDYFFLSIILSLQGALLCLAALKFFI